MKIRHRTSRQPLRQHLRLRQAGRQQAEGIAIYFAAFAHRAYEANNIYLAATYGETRNATYFDGTTSTGATAEGFANKTQDYSLVAQYQFDFGLRPSIDYTKSRAKDVEGIGDADLLNYFEVGTTYYFNRNMSTYVDYIINQIDDDNALGINSGDVVALGLVYQF